MNVVPKGLEQTKTPFDRARVDRLMEEAGLDVLLATSKHNVQYLLGGYKFIFFAAMDAVGHSRYLPIVVYEKGRPENAAYVGNRMENGEHANNPFWTPSLQLACWGTLDAANRAAEHLGKIGKSTRCSGNRCPTPSSSTRPRCWSACGRSRRRPSWKSCARLPS
jgi:Xaa-Pro dipeptidase